jgi:hypothetical protein
MSIDDQQANERDDPEEAGRQKKRHRASPFNAQQRTAAERAGNRPRRPIIIPKPMPLERQDPVPAVPRRVRGAV